MHEVTSMMHICPDLECQGLLVIVLVLVPILVLVLVIVLLLVLLLVLVLILLVSVPMASDIEHSASPIRVRYNGDRI